MDRLRDMLHLLFQPRARPGQRLRARTSRDDSATTPSGRVLPTGRDRQAFWRTILRRLSCGDQAPRRRRRIVAMLASAHTVMMLVGSGTADPRLAPSVANVWLKSAARYVKSVRSTLPS